MDLTQLKYFMQVADLEHITKAAEKLHVAQPAVSKTIKNLEKTLGCALFIRDGRNIKLTNYGKIVYKRTKRILNEVDLLYHDIQLEQAKTQNSISLSVQVASDLLPALINNFKKEHPEANIKIIQYDMDDINNKNYDLMIFSSVSEMKNDCTCTVLQEPIHLAIPNDHPLCQKEEIHYKDIVDAPFISMQRGGNLSEIIHHYCSLVGFTPNVVLICDNPATLRGMISHGMGLAFVPVKTWKSVCREPIVLREIAGLPCKRYINLRWKENGQLSPAAEQFRNMAIDYFRSMDNLGG